jgi:hypothetical protein
MRYLLNVSQNAKCTGENAGLTYDNSHVGCTYILCCVCACASLLIGSQATTEYLLVCLSFKLLVLHLGVIVYCSAGFSWFVSSVQTSYSSDLYY